MESNETIGKLFRASVGGMTSPCPHARRFLPVLLLALAAAAPVHAQQQEKDPHLNHSVSPSILYEGEGKVVVRYTPKSRPANEFGSGNRTEHYFEVGAAGSTASGSDYTLGLTSQHLDHLGQIVQYHIEITPAADAVAEGDETIVIGVEVRLCTEAGVCQARQYDGSVTVTIRNGPLPKVSLTPAALTMTEGGAASYGVKLDIDPGTAATVTVTSADVGIARVNGPGGSPGRTATLSFTGGAAGTWKTAQTVTVTAPVDFDSATGQVVLSHALGGLGGGRPAHRGPGLTVSVQDYTAGILVSKRAVTVDEGGAEGTYQLSLAGDPKGRIEVEVRVSGAHRGALEIYQQGTGVGEIWGQEASFNFNGSKILGFVDWENTVDVRLRAPADTNVLDDIIAVSHVSTTVDSRVPHVGNGPDVTVTARDLGGALTLAPTALSLAEGSEGSYTAKMAANPGGEVTVTATVSRRPPGRGDGTGAGRHSRRQRHADFHHRQLGQGADRQGQGPRRWRCGRRVLQSHPCRRRVQVAERHRPRRHGRDRRRRRRARRFRNRL